ncbi:MAG: hypothetical protein JKY19_11235, partial [Alcanivoracaceae bacterium]|nr:hypothetical protein [Alcanivoracaceae bacterium]
MYNIQLLNKKHDRKSFDCGHDEINRFLKQQANQKAKKSYSQTHVLTDEIRPTKIIGFHTLTTCLIDKPLQHQLNINYPHELFGVNLARMGVDVKFQGKLLSENLIFDAIYKTYYIDINMGTQGLFIDAKNDQLINYYVKYGFELIADTRRKMWMPIGVI